MDWSDPSKMARVLAAVVAVLLASFEDQAISAAASTACGSLTPHDADPADGFPDLVRPGVASDCQAIAGARGPARPLAPPSLVHAAGPPAAAIRTRMPRASLCVWQV